MEPLKSIHAQFFPLSDSLETEVVPYFLYWVATRSILHFSSGCMNYHVLILSHLYNDYNVLTLGILLAFTDYQIIGKISFVL